jgi:glyoxylase-like metal-dependent hydrolase (beta-lactamase superfamily II)
LIDTGLFIERWFLERALKRLGLPFSAIKRVLLTHGHLDHTGNLAWVRQRTGAEILIHPADREHLAQTYPYEPPNRFTGRLERLGCTVFRWKPVEADGWLEDGQVLDCWGGLKVIHAPGHTDGHCGFYSAEKEVLFLGDMLATYAHSSHYPHPVLNSRPELLKPSMEKLLDREIRYIIPNHYEAYNPEALTRRVRGFCEKHGVRVGDSGE